MKRSLLAVLAAAPVLMTQAPANAIPGPHLDGVYPVAVMERAYVDSSCTNDSKNSLRLDGQHLAAPDTTGFTWSRDVQVYMHWAGDPSWDLAPTSGWTPSQISLGCIDAKYERKYLDRSGTIEFVVTVRGAKSNVAQVRVLPKPTVVPQIASLSRSVFANRGSDHLIRVFAANLDDTSTVTIGGKPLAGNPVAHYAEGYIQGVLPPEISSTRGRYAVVVQNRIGASTNAAIVHVVAAPASIAAKRAPVQRGTAATGDETIEVAYGGDAPTAARVKGNGDWMNATFRDAGNGVGHLDVPAAAWNGRPAALTLEVSNVAGATTGSARIMYVTVLPQRLPPIIPPGPGIRPPL